MEPQILEKSAPASRWAIGAWLVFITACIAVIARTPFTTDISAFLPRSPTPAQQMLVEQLRDGVVSRLVLIGIEGAAPDTLARTSKQLAAALREQGSFASVNNGEESGFAKDREFLWRNRYLLSSAVTPERFSANGLRARLEENLQLLASPAGMLLRRTLPNDPTGELIYLLEHLGGQARPATRDGVWFSRDGSRALLVAETRVAGYDIDAHERVLGAIRGAFSQLHGFNETKLLLTGPGVFSVKSRAAIKGDALRFSLIATLLIGAMALAFYRSPRVLILSFAPVASGALAGVAAVSLGFGSVHGITLAFGVTLIGEGVDYAIFLFTRATPGIAPRETLDRIWPTLRLGMLTSICGFSAMLFSSFSGLAQLGLFSIAGLVVAVAVTRWVLPVLMPAGFTTAAVATLAPAAMAALRRAPQLRYPLLIALALAAASLALHRGPLWSDQLSSVNPMPLADQLLDQQLRGDIGAPDVRYLVVVSAPDAEAALQQSEAVAAALEGATRKGLLDGYDTPSTYLPSQQAQRERQAALPAPADLRRNLQQALSGLPYRPAVFEPYLKDAAAARTMPLLNRDSLQGTNFALKLDTILVRRGPGWGAILPLRGVTDAAGIAREMGALPGAQAVLLDLKEESEQLFGNYRREVLIHSLLGVAAIVALLFLGLRSPRRVFDVLAPLAAAVVITIGILAAVGQLSIFHLIGLLLVVAVGSNYSLFFDRRVASGGTDRERTVVSLLFACLSTLIGFGLLSFSAVPVLNAIGSTVGIGAALALACSAILSRSEDSARGGRF